LLWQKGFGKKALSNEERARKMLMKLVVAFVYIIVKHFVCCLYLPTLDLTQKCLLKENFVWSEQTLWLFLPQVAV